MKGVIVLMLCAQLFCAKAGRVKGAKEPTLTTVSCSDPGVEGAADLSLRQLSANRKEGFVLGLRRITNVQEQFDEENGSVFYITLDVVETQCHVLSRKLWKDCEAKPHHEAVIGQCKLTFQLNKPKRIAHLHNYDCDLRPADRGDFGCPGCLFSKPLNDSNFQEVAKKSLEKFNTESNYDKYFVIGNITKGSTQVVAGQAYHVEFTIHESTCNKTENKSQCTLLDCEFAHTGYCKTKAVAHWSTPDEKKVQSVSCDIFEPEAAIKEEQNHKDGHAADKPDSDKKDHHGKKGDRGKGKKHGHKKGHGHEHKHDHKQGQKHDHDHSESQEHEHDHEHLHNYEHHHSPPQKAHGPSSDIPKTVGTITYLVSDVAPSAVPKGQDNKRKGSKPDKKGKPSKSFILPFPDNASASAQCPGLAKNFPVIEDLPILEIPQEPTRIPK
ncbi:fetuin-B-like [Pseudophryne corroboree]|uniref:fetuin-B-like n=1 Tax=Pseudophryne corroboree TaxID=495146 RepID=UPI0030815258